MPHAGLLDTSVVIDLPHIDQLPLYTRNPGDFVGLDSLITVVAL